MIVVFSGGKAKGKSNGKHAPAPNNCSDAETTKLEAGAKAASTAAGKMYTEALSKFKIAATSAKKACENAKNLRNILEVEETVFPIQDCGELAFSGRVVYSITHSIISISLPTRWR